MKISNVEMLPVPRSNTNPPSPRLRRINWKLAALALATLATLATFAAPLRWTCSWPDAGAQSFALYRGETATFEPRLKINGVVATNAEIAAVWYTTNTMSSVASGEGGWWRLDNATFAPSNDVGALSYRFFVEFRVPGSGTRENNSSPETLDPSPETLYRANGTLRMLPSPGVTPNALPLPAKTIDFAEVEVENAPWPAEIEAAIAEIPTPDLSDYATHEDVAEAIAGITETDPVWEAEKADYLSQSEWQGNWEPILRDADIRSMENESAIGSITSAIESITNEFTYTAISNTVTKAYVEDLGIKPADPSYSWVRPDAWAIDVAIDKAEIAGTATIASSTTDAAGRVYTNVTYSTTFQMAAQCTPKMLDESSLYFPEIVEWAALPPGGNMDENGHFAAETSGLYRVSATAADGTTHYADVAISAERTEVTSNETAYVADDAAAAPLRFAAHTNALAVLNAATECETNYYGSTAYTVWNTFKPKFVAQADWTRDPERDPGDWRCWAVSQHILASASHHWPKRYNSQTFTDGANTYTVTKQVWVDLPTWATQHGFTEAEAAAVNDLSMILCTGDSLPSACRPSFLSPEKFERLLAADTKYLMGWHIMQTSEWAMPMVFTGPRFQGFQPWRETRRDIAERLAAMDFTFYPPHGGDSGHPIFLYDGSEYIAVAHFSSAGACRADYIAGFSIIKAFVEANGDTLKEVE